MRLQQLFIRVLPPTFLCAGTQSVYVNQVTLKRRAYGLEATKTCWSTPWYAVIPPSNVLIKLLQNHAVISLAFRLADHQVAAVGNFAAVRDIRQ